MERRGAGDFWGKFSCCATLSLAEGSYDAVTVEGAPAGLTFFEAAGQPTPRRDAHRESYATWGAWGQHHAFYVQSNDDGRFYAVAFGANNVPTVTSGAGAGRPSGNIHDETKATWTGAMTGWDSLSSATLRGVASLTITVFPNDSDGNGLYHLDGTDGFGSGSFKVTGIVKASDGSNPVNVPDSVTFSSVQVKDSAEFLFNRQTNFAGNLSGRFYGGSGNAAWDEAAGTFWKEHNEGGSLSMVVGAFGMDRCTYASPDTSC